MSRRAKLGLMTVILAVAVILAATVYGWTQSAAAKTSCCATAKGASGTPCPFTPVGGAAREMMAPKMGGHPGLGVLRAALKLTPDQEREITGEISQFKADNAAVFGELKTKRVELHRMLITGSPTKAQVAARVDEISALHSRLMLDATERVLDARSILTPEQLKTLADKADQLVPTGMSGACGMKDGCVAAEGMVCELGVGCRMAGSKSSAIPGGPKVAAAATKATDPVCKMTISTKDAAGKSQYKGKMYYFCNAACKARFDKNPGQYVK